MGLKICLKKIDNKPGKYRKDFMKIKFNFDGKLLLNKILRLYILTRIVKSVFQVDNKYYTKCFRWSFVWVIKMLQYERNLH